MVDFDRHQPVSGSISLGRKKREKKRENMEIWHCSPNPDVSPTGFSVLPKENLRQSRGEENDTRRMGFLRRLQEEISSPRMGRRNEATSPTKSQPALVLEPQSSKEKRGKTSAPRQLIPAAAFFLTFQQRKAPPQSFT
ncbi:hypothetical protein BHE74_00025399 [Ensete ventricosum]|nr:hypothetical protein BHE74_00025399 [Ensete ventricosum]RZR95257.1 hypothetical protein BHM03_00024069 [Ensete ventricosum]